MYEESRPEPNISAAQHDPENPAIRAPPVVTPTIQEKRPVLQEARTRAPTNVESIPPPAIMKQQKVEAKPRFGDVEDPKPKANHKKKRAKVSSNRQPAVLLGKDVEDAVEEEESRKSCCSWCC